MKMPENNLKAKPSQAKPSQAKPSQAKPSQAKPSQAKPSQAKTKQPRVKSQKPREYKLEDHVNDWVKAQFDKLRLKNQRDYYTESAIPDYLKDALKGRAKTANKSNFGKPDFSLTQYQVPVVIENKLGVKKLIADTKNVIKFDDKSI